MGKELLERITYHKDMNRARLISNFSEKVVYTVHWNSLISHCLLYLFQVIQIHIVTLKWKCFSLVMRQPISR